MMTPQQAREALGWALASAIPDNMAERFAAMCPHQWQSTLSAFARLSHVWEAMVEAMDRGEEVDPFAVGAAAAIGVLEEPEATAGPLNSPAEEDPPAASLAGTERSAP